MAQKLLTIMMGVLFAVTLMGIFWMIYNEKSKSSKNGMVVSSRKKCARIGGYILKMNGSVADVAIATLFCEGLYQPQNMGIGGGFLALIYNKSNSSSKALIALESVPLEAKDYMFSNDSFRDELTIAVAAEIRVYFELHRKYGRLKWADLVAPTIKICESGYKVDDELAFDLKYKEDEIRKIDSLKEMFINPSTGNVYQKGDIIRNALFAETLRSIAEQGEAAIYNPGNIELVNDIRNFGDILTEDNLKHYKLHWNDSVKTKYFHYTIHAMPLFESEFLVNLIQHMKIPEPERQKEARKDHHLRIKFHRYQDVKTFNVLEYYSHSRAKAIHNYAVGGVAIVAPTGDAIAVTSTVHSRFGSMRRSHQTGIIFNDHMRYLSNRKPEHISMRGSNLLKFAESANSSFFLMHPTIITDINGYPKMILSSCGDLNTTYSLAKIVIENLRIRSKTRANLFKIMRQL